MGPNISVPSVMYSRVPNNSAARLLIFQNFSLPTRLIWTYTLIKFLEKILPTRLLCTYTVVDFFLFWLIQKICYLFTYTLLTLWWMIWKGRCKINDWIPSVSGPKLRLSLDAFLPPTLLFKLSFFPPTRLLGPTLLLDFSIFYHLHCY